MLSLCWTFNKTIYRQIHHVYNRRTIAKYCYDDSVLNRKVWTYFVKIVYYFIQSRSNSIINHDSWLWFNESLTFEVVRWQIYPMSRNFDHSDSDCEGFQYFTSQYALANRVNIAVTTFSSSDCNIFHGKQLRRVILLYLEYW